ncbi:hypothetical protein [Butyrivibrio sp. VCB2006]|uniref:hypothetical protein n=1 Tax=Butyrivibrio sp. VCB2006 TaxID=1280679 RepID=UPI0012DC1E3C|nr:hypothetical protein [Butyrivibrio sp. VCB2006]
MKKWNNAELVSLDLNATESGRTCANIEASFSEYYSFHDAEHHISDPEHSNVAPDKHS